MESLQRRPQSMTVPREQMGMYIEFLQYLQADMAIEDLERLTEEIEDGA